MATKRNWYDGYIYQPPDRFAGLPADLAALVKGELTEGEEILWMEQPSVERLGRGKLKYFIYCPLFLTLIQLLASLWIYGGSFTKFLASSLLLVPFYITGSLGVLIAPVLIAREAKNLAYVITNRKVIHINTAAFWNRKVKNYYFNQQIFTNALKTKVYKDGSGNISLVEESNPIKNKTCVGFAGIKQVENVKTLLMQGLTRNKENPVKDLPPEVQSAVKALLDAEKVVWVGQPNPERLEHEEKTTSRLSNAGLRLWAVLTIFSLGLLLVGITEVSLLPFLIGLFSFVLSIRLLLSVSKSIAISNYSKHEQSLKVAYIITDQRAVKIEINEQDQESRRNLTSFGRELIQKSRYFIVSVKHRI